MDEPSMSEGHQFAVFVKTINWLQGLRVGEMVPGPGCQLRVLPASVAQDPAES